MYFSSDHILKSYLRNCFVWLDVIYRHGLNRQEKEPKRCVSAPCGIWRLQNLVEENLVFTVEIGCAILNVCVSQAMIKPILTADDEKLTYDVQDTKVEVVIIWRHNNFNGSWEIGCRCLREEEFNP